MSCFMGLNKMEMGGGATSGLVFNTAHVKFQHTDFQAVAG